MWGKTLADINSVDINDLHEYNSRPNQRVLELMNDKKNNETNRSLVVYYKIKYTVYQEGCYSTVMVLSLLMIAIPISFFYRRPKHN